MAPQLGPQVIFDFGTLTTDGEEGASGGFSTVLTGSGQMPASISGEESMQDAGCSRFLLVETLQGMGSGANCR